MQIPKKDTTDQLNQIPEGVKSESEERLDQVPFGNFNDPVRMYFREMGSVSLLNREEEVEIAKRIEQGEMEILETVSCNPICIREVILIDRFLHFERHESQHHAWYVD